KRPDASTLRPRMDRTTLLLPLQMLRGTTFPERKETTFLPTCLMLLFREHVRTEVTAQTARRNSTTWDASTATPLHSIPRMRPYASKGILTGYSGPCAAL